MVIITELTHSSHPDHVLKLTNRIETPYKCDGCKEQGFHPCYQCHENGCDFHLHEHCAKADHSAPITHAFFDNIRFIFHNNFRPQSRISLSFCVACGKSVQGFKYQSFCGKAHVIHPCCLNLPLALSAPQGDQEVKLRLLKKSKYWPTSKCLRCQNRKISKDIHGWVYVSTSGDFCYHVACVQDLILDRWKTDQLQYPNGDPGRQTLQLAIEHNNLPQRKVRKIQWVVIKVALHLLIGAIFGEAIGGIIDLIF
ncbi:hypothetical protein F2P56_017150 [Juglans regia]|uniref:Uncharacterized protein LOC108986340 n=2 Tax=Juglans regia TaxID=51240 RepID=A0A2I4E501_JUGRE|nr:uncharacterized protein LOC108986340 [Juglans regia]KAF5467316.1 hypothetical protein F2P56_017150 [Juglans regia]